MSSHKRKDSGIAQSSTTVAESTNTGDDAKLRDMQAFLDAARGLTSHVGYHSLTDLLDRKQKTDKEIESHSRIVRRLNQTINNLETSLEEERSTIKKLEKTCESLSGLKAAKDAADTRVKGLEKALATERNASSEQAALISKLQEDLETSKFEAEGLTKDMFTQKARAQAAENEMSRLESYRARLYPDEQKNVVNKVKDLWEDLYKFAKTFLHVDLSELILTDEPAWDKLHKAVRELELPRSNTTAAKNMRLAAVLSLLASKIVYHIFQPTYSIAADSEIYDALAQQAFHDVQHERDCRAVLLGMLPEEQDQRAQLRAQSVYEGVWTAIRDLVDNKPEPQTELKKCISKAFEFWRYTRDREELFFFSFGPCYEDDDSQPMKFPADNSSKGQNVSSMPDHAARGREVLVVFPHLYVPDKQVLPAMVVWEYQVQVARTESKTQATKGPERAASLRMPRRSGGRR